MIARTIARVVTRHMSRTRINAMSRRDDARNAHRARDRDVNAYARRHVMTRARVTYERVARDARDASLRVVTHACDVALRVGDVARARVLNDYRVSIIDDHIDDIIENRFEYVNTCAYSYAFDDVIDDDDFYDVVYEYVIAFDDACDALVSS